MGNITMIIVIDFGSQFNQLIARRVRENSVYCQVEPASISIDRIKQINPKGIILSGGPSSIYEENSPSIDKALFDLGIPVLGICYGMHYMVHTLGGVIQRADRREYGFANLEIKEELPIFKGMESSFQCWMSHGDSAKELPPGFVVTASTENTSIAAIADHDRKFYGLQLHPEVEHSLNGSLMIRHFLFDVCQCEENWTMKSFSDGAIAQIKDAVGDDNIFIFGLTADEVETAHTSGDYRPWEHYKKDPELAGVLDSLQAGDFVGADAPKLTEVWSAIMEHGDRYMHLADFRPYLEAQLRVDELYRDRRAWAAAAIRNVAAMGYFSSDRAIRDYAEKIWNLKPVPVTQVSRLSHPENGHTGG